MVLICGIIHNLFIPTAILSVSAQPLASIRTNVILPVSVKTEEADGITQNEPSKTPLFAVTRNGWYYPARYLGTDGRDTVQNGGAFGRHFQTTVTGVEQLTSGNESGEIEFHGRIDGPDVPGWDLWNDEHCIRFDFRAVLTLTVGITPNVESRFSRIDVSSGGFTAIQGRLHFYDVNNNRLGTLYWSSTQDGQVRTANVNWNQLRYAYVCMSTGLSSDTPWNGWVVVNYIKVRPSSVTLIPDSLPPDQALTPNECPFCGNADRQNYVGGPINTQSGNYSYQAADFDIPTAGRPLRFERTYNSYTVLTHTVTYSRPLGYGWTHNYDLNLTFAPGEVQLKAPHGSRMRFTDHGDGDYSPFPGVWAEMVRSGSGTTTVYTVTTAHQEQFVFNHLGRWIRHLDPKGNVTTLTRTNGITLTRVTGPTGQHWLDFTYDVQGRLASVTDHTGRQVSYSYDTNDNLITVTDTRGNDWRYTYDANHLLQEVRDPENNIIERTLYDSQGRAIRQEDGAGNPLIEISYLPNGQRFITDHGRQSTDTYDPTTNLLVKQTDALSREWTYSLDDHFNRTAATDPRGNPTGYAKTAFGLTTAITDALGNVTTFGYDSRNNLTAATNAQGVTFNYTYDSQNNLTRIDTPTGPILYTYNPAGQVTSVTDRRGHTWHYQYDPAGNLVQIVNPKSEIVNLQYDALGRLTALTNPRGMTTRFEYDPAGNLTRLIRNAQSGLCHPNECNLTTEYRYDKANRLTAVIDPAGRETRYEYDPAGRLSRVIRNYQDGVFDDAAPDRDLVTRYQYDGYGRLQSVIETLNQSEERETRYEYDALNRISRVILNYAPGSSDPDQNLVTTYAYQDSGRRLIVTVTGPDGVATRTEYDELGRPAKIIRNYQTGPCPANECNLTTEYSYDDVGNLTGLLDPLGVRTQYEYDALNRLTAVIENYTGNGTWTGLPDENIKTQFTYDPEGNLTQISLLSTLIATRQYDELNRLIQQANALGHTWSYNYDAAGNLTQITDPKLQITHYQYDLLNRLTQIQNSQFTIQNFYDKTGNRTQMTDGTGTTTYSYDNLNRPTQIVNPKSEIVNLQYDARGNRTQLIYPNGKTVAYSYDRLDRLTSLTPSWDSGSYRYSYNSQLQLESLTRPNGLTTHYGYDSANRLTNITHQTPLTQTPTAAYTYTLDAVGNIVQAEEYLAAPTGGSEGGSGHIYYFPLIFKNSSPGSPPPPGPTPTPPPPPITPTHRFITYSYDHLYRLTRADYSTGEYFHYTYDPAGNRLTQSTISGTTVYTYDAANRLAAVDGVPYTWDANGNLLNDGQRTYRYDAANRLISVTGGITASFTYNGDGDRISQTVNGLTTEYILDPTGLAQVLVATAGGQSTYYLPGLAQYDGSRWEYFVQDRLGSIRQLVDPTGQLLLSQSFDSFGSVLAQAGAGQSRFGCTGEQVDPTGLVYLRARYYAPGVGRFLTPDTVVPDPLRSIGWNGYVYTGNNPVRYTDPSGHCSPEIPVCNDPWLPLREIWNNTPKLIEEIDGPVKVDYQTGVPPVREPNIQAAKMAGLATITGDTVAFGLSSAGTTGQIVAGGLMGPSGVGIVHTAYEISPLGLTENGASIAAWMGTLVSDYVLGNTSLAPPGGGVQIGQDTYILGCFGAMGLVPLGPVYDQVINIESLAYDINSFNSMTSPDSQGRFPSIYNASRGTTLNESLPGNILIRGIEINLGGNKYLHPNGNWVRIGWPRQN